MCLAFKKNFQKTKNIARKFKTRLKNLCKFGTKRKKFVKLSLPSCETLCSVSFDL